MQDLADLPYIEYPDDDGAIQRIYANVQETETIDLQAEITDHPVESGVNITDHIRKTPDMITLELFFTDTITRTDILGNDKPDLDDGTEIKVQSAGFSLTTLTSTSGLLGSVLDLVKPKEKIIAYSYEPPTTPRMVALHDTISSLQEAGTLISAKTTMALYENMAIQGATLSRSKDTGNGGRIQLTLKKIRFVQSDITLALPIPKDARAQQKKDAGKGTKTVTEPKSSTLKKTSDATGLTTPGSGI